MPEQQMKSSQCDRGPDSLESAIEWNRANLEILITAGAVMMTVLVSLAFWIDT